MMAQSNIGTQNERSSGRYERFPCLMTRNQKIYLSGVLLLCLDRKSEGLSYKQVTSESLDRNVITKSRKENEDESKILNCKSLLSYIIMSRTSSPHQVAVVLH
jgi:hypothetical protein